MRTSTLCSGRLCAVACRKPECTLHRAEVRRQPFAAIQCDRSVRAQATSYTRVACIYYTISSKPSSMKHWQFCTHFMQLLCLLKTLALLPAKP